MGQRTASTGAVRQAREYDLVELVRLQAPLSADLDGDWLDALAVVLRDQLTADDVRVLVVDAVGGGLAACGIGTIDQRLPGPGLHNGRTGHVMGVVTDPDHRRRGHGRTVMDALLAWFREREVARVELRAPAEDEPLYRALGFADHPDAPLYWRPSEDRAVTPSR